MQQRRPAATQICDLSLSLLQVTATWALLARLVVVGEEWVVAELSEERGEEFKESRLLQSRVGELSMQRRPDLSFCEILLSPSPP